MRYFRIITFAVLIIGWIDVYSFALPRYRRMLDPPFDFVTSIQVPLPTPRLHCVLRISLLRVG
jgi:hypothetical protein